MLKSRGVGLNNVVLEIESRPEEQKVRNGAALVIYPDLGFSSDCLLWSTNLPKEQRPALDKYVPPGWDLHRVALRGPPWGGIFRFEQVLGSSDWLRPDEIEHVFPHHPFHFPRTR